MLEVSQRRKNSPRRPKGGSMSEREGKTGDRERTKA